MSGARTSDDVLCHGSIRREGSFSFFLPFYLPFYLTNTSINEFGPSDPQAHKSTSFFTLPFCCLIPISHMFFSDKEHLLFCVCSVPSKQGPPSGELGGYGKKMSIKKLWWHEDPAEHSLRSDFMPLSFCLASDSLFIFTEYQTRSLQQKCIKKD